MWFDLLSGNQDLSDAAFGLYSEDCGLPVFFIDFERRLGHGQVWVDNRVQGILRIGKVKVLKPLKFSVIPILR